MVSKQNVLIIGAGIGGLASAALLAKNGFNVTILEKNNFLGGRASHFRKGRFTFDLGPSWYLMSEIFENFFNQFGESCKNFYQLKKINPSFRVFFSDNNFIDVFSNIKKTEQQTDIKIARYLKKTKGYYDITLKNFLYRPDSNLKFVYELISNLLKLDPHKTFQDLTSEFFSNPYTQKIFNFTTFFLGSTPAKTPAFYSLINYSLFRKGVFYPMGGMRKITESIVYLCKQEKVKIILKISVEKIKVNKKKAFQLVTTKGLFNADIIISNADLAFTELKLIEKKYRSYPINYWKKKIFSPSAFIIYLGLSKKINALGHHNLFFSDNWEENIKALGSSSWPNKPSFYVCCPSKTDPRVIPDRLSENLFILIPISKAVNDSKLNQKKFFKKIINILEEKTGQNINDSIRVKRIFSVTDFKKYFNSYQGSTLGLGHTFFQTSFFRPKQKSSKIKNLYYIGQYTHPGVGLPMVLVSAQNVVKQILKDNAK